MNIVIIVDSYYPEMSATATCINKFIQVLKASHSIDIVNVQNRYKFEDLADDAITVHYIADIPWKLRMYCEDCIRQGKWITLNKLMIYLFKLRSVILSAFLYPSSQKWRIKKYYSTLNKLHQTKHVDVVISISDPIECAFSVVNFKKQYPEIRWINWFMDPFTFQPSKYRYILSKQKRQQRNYKQEKEAYDTADYNLFTEELYELALSKFSQPKYKTFKIKYVLEPVPYIETPQREEHTTIKLVYAGTFLRDKRNPMYCLSILSQMSNITFDMYVNYSNCGDIVARYTSNNIQQLPSVNRERYCQIIACEYDILVNLGNNIRLQIPSKMFELLSTGRPILNFYQLKDSQYEMIEKYPLGLNIGPNEKNAIEKIQQFCKNVKGKRLSFTEVEALFPDHTLQTQLKILENLIQA